MGRDLYLSVEERQCSQDSAEIYACAGGRGGRVNSQGSQLGYDLLFLLGESVFKYSERYLAYIDLGLLLTLKS